MWISEKRVPKTKVRASVDTADLGALAWGAPVPRFTLTPSCPRFLPADSSVERLSEKPIHSAGRKEHVTLALLFLSLTVHGI